ncbi:MAG: hypothetical protein PVH88_04415 [Ignavibacteria bacterium]|jgi:hypothetical protein
MNSVLSKITALLFLITFFLIGCTPSVTINRVQGVKTEASSINIPVKITQNKEKRPGVISTYVMFNGNKTKESYIEGHTDVNQNGKFIIDTLEQIGPIAYQFEETEGDNDYIFDGNNFIVKNPDFELGFEIDYALTNFLALTGGGNICKYDNKAFLGGNFGFGFFKETENLGFRMDIGWESKHTRSEATFVMHDKDFVDGKREGVIYKIARSESFIDPFASFTLNTKKAEWPVNLFFNFQLGYKTYYDYSLQRIDIADVFFAPLLNKYQFDVGEFEKEKDYKSFGFGLYYNVGDYGRIIIGAWHNTFDDEGDDFTETNTFIQYNFLF